MPIGLVLGRDQQMRATTKSTIDKVLTDNGRGNVAGHRRVCGHVALTLSKSKRYGGWRKQRANCMSNQGDPDTMGPTTYKFLFLFFFFFFTVKSFGYINMRILTYVTITSRTEHSVDLAGCTYRGRLLKTIGFICCSPALDAHMYCTYFMCP